MSWKARFPVLLRSILLLLGPLSCGQVTSAGPEHFSGELAYRHVQAQVAIGPRYAGSEGAGKAADYIAGELRRLGWEVEEQRFDYLGVALRNIVGVRGQGPVVMLGAHYDSRRWADRDPDPGRWRDPVPGANDGASGVAILLELARVLGRVDLQVQVRLAFFDAEDQGNIESWPWCIGSSYMARNLPLGQFPHYVVVVDMVGDASQQLYWERFSDTELQRNIWDLAAELGYRDSFTPTLRHAMIDDHRPFLERGIRAADIIDFDYPYWHTVADSADKVSPQSLERVGRVLEEMVRRRVAIE